MPANSKGTRSSAYIAGMISRRDIRKTTAAPQVAVSQLKVSTGRNQCFSAGSCNNVEVSM